MRDGTLDNPIKRESGKNEEESESFEERDFTDNCGEDAQDGRSTAAGESEEE